MAVAYASAAPRLTEQPVWRGSVDVDDPRAQVARPIGDGTKDGAVRFIRSYIEAMKDYAEHIRAPGKAHEITANTIKLVERVLWKCTDWKTGRCEVTLERVMEVTNFSRPTVVRLLSVARRWRFIDWVRRTVKTGNAPGDGPRVAQTANAYFFEVSRLPVEAYRRLKQLLGPKALPKEYPERTGSGPVPRKFARKAMRLVRNLARPFSQSLLAGPKEIAERDRLLESLPLSAWAAVIHPNDPAAQRLFNEDHGLVSKDGASCESFPDSRDQNIIQKD